MGGSRFEVYKSLRYGQSPWFHSSNHFNTERRLHLRRPLYMVQSSSPHEVDTLRGVQRLSLPTTRGPPSACHKLFQVLRTWGSVRLGQVLSTRNIHGESQPTSSSTTIIVGLHRRPSPPSMATQGESIAQSLQMFSPSGIAHYRHRAISVAHREHETMLEGLAMSRLGCSEGMDQRNRWLASLSNRAHAASWVNFQDHRHDSIDAYITPTTRL